MEEIRNYTFKLGNNFSEFLVDHVKAEINHLNYYDAFYLLKQVGLNDELIIGILFNDYILENTSTDIIVKDNMFPLYHMENGFDLFYPIENFINNYHQNYLNKLRKIHHLLFDFRTLKNKYVSIDVYNTNDEDINILNKYFHIPFSLLFNPESRGIMDVDALKFYQKLYNIFISDVDEFYKLVNILDVSFYEEILLEDFSDYEESVEIINEWIKVENSFLFLCKYSYREHMERVRILDNKLSGIKEYLNLFKSWFT